MHRDDFPILQQPVHGKTLTYLDNAASSQKPKVVIDAINQYYCHDHANVHRGIHTLSERATNAYEAARRRVQQFIHAAHEHEIIFTRGTTESINLVAASYGRLAVRAGDEIIISVMEHHANIVPWQQLCEQTGAQLRAITIDENGCLDWDSYTTLLNPHTKLVCITHVSNVLGTINPVKAMIDLAHQQNIPVLLDGAQAIAHMPVDVQALDCDFYAFSSHKMYGPTGIGVLYGKTKWLQAMPPYQTGGNMIKRVRLTHSEFAGLPNKFEAGTPPIAAAVGLHAAIEYINSIGFTAIMAHEQELIHYTLKHLAKVPNLRLIGAATQQVGVFSLILQAAHPHDIATILDTEGVAVRAGHHCAMPLMEELGVPATLRVSLGLYNNFEDIDHLIFALQKVTEIFYV